MIQSAGAIFHGMFCIAWLDEQTGEGKLQALRDLGEVGEQLCTDAFQRAYNLHAEFMQWARHLKNSEEQEGNHA